MSARFLAWGECKVEPSIEEWLVEAIHMVDEAEAAVGGEALATARCLLRGLGTMSAKEGRARGPQRRRQEL